jgi:predicted Fe-Mo cluster-binding NifX family protein
MKIALTTWEGWISPVFDVARQLLVVEIDDGKIAGRKEEQLPGDETAAQIDRLVQLDVQVLICGAISQPMVDMADAQGIVVFPFVSGKVDEIITAWLENRLNRRGFRMPGYCGQFYGGRRFAGAGMGRALWCRGGGARRGFKSGLCGPNGGMGMGRGNNFGAGRGLRRANAQWGNGPI